MYTGLSIRRLYADVAFIIVTVDFYEVGTIRFDTTCHCVPFFAINETKRKLCPL